eukprot:CAMPEP_0197937288 /NCGR_PEP_ID=MMETSP1439-20131203/116277_1 /TAXON_ID=66791 /ORGANISM="Gonyaulax spinifera, Strain CCMP409" /LENGTH=60 /DNA_ID=CAMNT_0043560309 /DNA_START=126 /DNA_END=304 /DNA_ORIENTATION=-
MALMGLVVFDASEQGGAVISLAELIGMDLVGRQWMQAWTPWPWSSASGGSWRPARGSTTG